MFNAQMDCLKIIIFFNKKSKRGYKAFLHAKALTYFPRLFQYRDFFLKIESNWLRCREFKRQLSISYNNCFEKNRQKKACPKLIEQA